MSDSTSFDVIIVGAGLVGLTLAKALADCRLQVAVVEAGAIAKRKPKLDEFDLRVSAITRGSQQLFTTLDVWPSIADMRIHPFYEMHVWDATGGGAIHFDSAELGEPCLGHIVENGVIHHALWKALKGHACLSIYEKHPAQSFSVHASHVELKLHSGETLTGALLVGADGSGSWVRKEADIGVHRRDYQQSALVTNVRTEHPHQETAWQRFLPNGPLAFLPLSEGYSSIVWTTTPEEAAELEALDETDFTLRLQSAFDDRLGYVTAAGARGVFPLRFLSAENYIKPRVALAGDAAHTIHPLAGQGVNLGLADAASLAQVLISAKHDSRDLGGVSVLRRYERWRRAENMAMLQVVDGFQRLYGAQGAALPWVRSAGMQALDKLGPLKNFIIQYAMGQRGDLPALNRGRSLCN